MAHRTIEQRIEALARDDKWFLSSGDGILWAPAFPVWLDRPGFWDEAHVYYHPFAPLFSVGLVGADGREVPLKQTDRRWRPDRLVCRYEAGDGVLVETKWVEPGGRFVSSWHAEGQWGKGLHLVAFTAQPGAAVSKARPQDGGVRWRRVLDDRRGVGMEVEVSLGVQTRRLEATAPASHMTRRLEATAPALHETRRLEATAPASHETRRLEATAPASHEARRLEATAPALHEARRLEATTPALHEARRLEATTPASHGQDARATAVRSERSVIQPWLRYTPFLERWQSAWEVRLEGINTDGLAYVAVDQPMDGCDEIAFYLDVVPVEPAWRLPHATKASQRCDPDKASAPWRAFFGSFPELTCSDPYLERYYDYRLYGLHLNRLEGGAGNVRHPAIAEGISYFHVPITYSGQCHMIETRWSADPAVARGTLLNFVEHQKPDGSFHGRLYTNHLHGTDFYHANWGDCVLMVDAVHPDDGYLGRVYGPLCRYAAWLDETRDAAGSGMYDVVNHFETGQEFMSRYQAVNPKADIDGWKDSTHLKAIDATVYAYLLKEALGRMARRLGREGGGGEADTLDEQAGLIGRAIMGRMWNAEAGIFSDVNPDTMERTGVKAAVCFYPMLTDLLDESHVALLIEHLEDPDGFATPWPIPSSSADDPLFDADARWKGKRHNCPWNGRVWPMTNSHVIEGLLRQWRLRDPGCDESSPRWRAGELAGRLLGRYVRMMFHDRDLGRPNCYEHYNPMTGHACEYRGIDDYQHSWVLDLLIRALAGIDPDGSRVVVDPLPMAVDWAELRSVRVAGRELSVRRDGSGVRVEIDGRVYESCVGEPIEIG